MSEFDYIISLSSLPRNHRDRTLHCQRRLNLCLLLAVTWGGYLSYSAVVSVCHIHCTRWIHWHSYWIFEHSKCSHSISIRITTWPSHSRHHTWHNTKQTNIHVNSLIAFKYTLNHDYNKQTLPSWHGNKHNTKTHFSEAKYHFHNFLFQIWVSLIMTNNILQ